MDAVIDSAGPADGARCVALRHGGPALDGRCDVTPET
jgi:hypothetical protein